MISFAEFVQNLFTPLMSWHIMKAFCASVLAIWRYNPKPEDRGRPEQPKVVVDPELRYPTVHKTRVSGKVVRVERNVIFGDPRQIEAIIASSPVSNTINTSFIERANLTLRHHHKKLARKTLCFAKRRQFLDAQTNITVAHYNFSKPHRGLTQKGPEEKRVKRTPGMAAKLIDRVRPMRETLAYPLRPNND
jgi:hypothetical protein